MNTKPTSPYSCRLCGINLDHSEIIADYVFGGSSNQRFYHCSNCDIVFLYPPMTQEEEQQFYSGEFEKFMETRSGGDFDWSGPETHIKSNQKQAERRFPYFSDLISSEKSVLEIGCSSGFMLLPLKQKSVEVVGIEPSGGFTKFLKSNDITVYSSIEELLTSSQIKLFDLVMHFFVLEHLRDPVGFLKQTLNLVKAGGHMVFEVPSRSDPLLSIYNIPAFHKFYWSIAHNWYFNHNSLEYILNRVANDFEIMNEQRYDLSNHMTWALEEKPGGQSKYSALFTPALENAYRQSMIETGHCDTLICRICKTE